MSSTIAHDRALRPLVAVIVGLLAVALTGCASADADTETPSTDTEVSTPAETEGDDGAGGGDGGADAQLGTITAGTTTYSVVDTVNCEPVQSSDLVTETFSSIAVAVSREGDEVLFFAYTQEQSGVNANFIDYQGPEGTWSTQEGNATFTVTDGTLSGASVVVNDDATESMMLQFTFTIPTSSSSADGRLLTGGGIL